MTSRKWLLGIVFVALLVGAIYLINAMKTPDDGSLRVAVFQVVRHPALDAMAESFERTLTKEYSGKLRFELMVPEGDPGKTEQMAQRIVTEEYDLVFVIGTNLAQSLQKKTKSIPIVLGGATDPVSAQLVASWDKPGGNITGTSDLSPVGVQLDRLAEILPDVKRIGIVYNPSEDNSQAILAKFKEECAARGLTPVSVTISSANEIQQTVVSLVGRVEALYAPTDATVQSAFPALIRVANETKIPVFNCDRGTVEKGALFSIGFDYADLGVASAEMAAMILKGEAEPRDMPIQLVAKSTFYFNLAQAQELGLEIPAAWATTGADVGQ